MLRDVANSDDAKYTHLSEHDIIVGDLAETVHPKPYKPKRVATNQGPCDDETKQASMQAPPVIRLRLNHCYGNRFYGLLTSDACMPDAQ